VRVVADAGPLHYLVLIRQIDLLPRLFGGVAIPEVVRDELDQPTTPASVRTWIVSPPSWLSVMPGPLADMDAIPAALDDGERAAIALGVSLSAELLLMDDRAGVAAARTRGLAVTGTLGLLDRAARRGLVDLVAAFDALKATNFHTRQALLDTLLAAWKNDGRL
jgi:predicted nucleic acid-binding protein